jgi:hypothetical protein
MVYAGDWPGHIINPHLGGEVSNVLCLDMHVDGNADIEYYQNGTDSSSFPNYIFPYQAD